LKRGHVCPLKDEEDIVPESILLPPLSAQTEAGKELHARTELAVESGAFGPLPPISSLFDDDDNDTGISDTVAKVVAKAAEAVSVTTSVTTSDTLNPDTSVDICSMLNDASDQSGQSTILGVDVIRSIGLVKHRVCGDGSCIDYAVLATAGLCEHASLRAPSKIPTPIDRGRDAMLRVRSYDYLCKNATQLNLTSEDKNWLPKLLIMPKYPLRSEADMGTFGNMLSICAISKFIGMTIVVWNRKTLRSTSVRQQVAVYLPETDSTEERLWSASHILETHRQNPLVHIEWDGLNHYSAFVEATPIQFSQIAMADLTTAPRVEEDSTDALPLGWSKYVNCYREPDKMSNMKNLLPSTRKQCADVLSKGYNAFAVYGSQVVYLQYSGNIKSKDLMPVVDMEMTLYTCSFPSKKRKMPPSVDYSCCNKMYLSDSKYMACSECDRKFHISCVLREFGVSKSKEDAWLNTNADAWLCGYCKR
jgi:hypothetical protein